MSHTEDLLMLVRERGLLRARDLYHSGIPRLYLSLLVEKGDLVQIGRGLYAVADVALTEHQTLLEAMVRVPYGIICLASALRFHGITTQNPWKVWMMIESGKRIPRVDYPALQVVQASGTSFHEGTELHTIDGVTLRVTSVAKTIADCFKYRSKIGLDVALEGLKQTLQEHRATREQIRLFAKICRVERVMTPYLEAFSL